LILSPAFAGPPLFERPLFISGAAFLGSRSGQAGWGGR
jgi:hypothetical protein